MNQILFYCQSWSVGYKEPLGISTSQWAEKRHKSGDTYTVLVGSENTPSCFIDVMKNRGWVSVSFLDKDKREFLVYSFKIINDNKLFLSMAIYREFIEGIDRVASGTTYIFKENGHTVIRKENIEPHSLEESETFTDVSGNYDKFPDFGCYDSLIKIDR
ncbi:MULTISPECIES: hypothetical protein [Yersinia pseudotuberculosis complex]|uniref:Lytic transglycosylase n=3 Tax=Yersinia pseudotuberculosis TaxID=633 RepID=A0A0U1R2N6_YERP3|nr:MULTISPECIES: hypothetical protein [Yersinia pseudotuberculosis complex]ABS49549.1 conserved hypothetical protein [Yersinia pseudotuberculosis IP 31758]AJK16060.1 hypothetical protein BZ19_2913 [Yersinia pseudotuberculosis str. PA3606]MCE4114833.1 hypothetical protein [Yersinia pseudotuberculosis]MCF1165444.1 hypothetical protein [Yersinia pseudotuberculosis]RYC17221.1 lytic transglycosylase [Yersinia pseudotuberculosis]